MRVLHKGICDIKGKIKNIIANACTWVKEGAKSKRKGKGVCGKNKRKIIPRGWDIVQQNYNHPKLNIIDRSLQIKKGKIKGVCMQMRGSINSYASNSILKLNKRKIKTFACTWPWGRNIR